MSGTENQLEPRSTLPQLVIVGGLHDGVRMTLEDSEYVVGPDADADIVLRDDGVLSRHAVLRIEGGEARVEAIGGDVIVGGMKVATGHGCRARMPVTILIGGASLQLSPPWAAHSAFGSLRSTLGRFADHPVKLAGGVMVCALAIAAASHGVQHQPSVTQLAATNSLQHSASEDRSVAPPEATSPLSPVAQTASEELTGRLRDVGISTVRVSAVDGRVLAEGRLNEQQAAAWSSLQRWFDAKYASSTVLVANVAIGPLAGPAPIRLQAVYFGQRPYIIADNGSRYYEGAVLESGWTVQQIGKDRVVLLREGETLALTYR